MKKMIPAILVAAILTSCGNAASNISAMTEEDILTATKECYDSITDKELIKTAKKYHDGKQFISDLYVSEIDMSKAYIHGAPEDILTEDELRVWAVGECNAEYVGQKLALEYETDEFIVVYDQNAKEPDSVNETAGFFAEYGGRIVVPKNFRQIGEKADREYRYVGELTEEAVKKSFDMLFATELDRFVPGSNIMLARNVYTDDETGEIHYDMLSAGLGIGMWGRNEIHEFYSLYLSTITVGGDTTEIKTEIKESRQFEDGKKSNTDEYDLEK